MALKEYFFHHLVEDIMAILWQCIGLENITKGPGFIVHSQILENLFFHPFPKLWSKSSCFKQSCCYSGVVFHVDVPHCDSDVSFYFLQYLSLILSFWEVLKYFKGLDWFIEIDVPLIVQKPLLDLIKELWMNFLKVESFDDPSYSCDMLKPARLIFPLVEFLTDGFLLLGV